MDSRRSLFKTVRLPLVAAPSKASQGLALRTGVVPVLFAPMPALLLAALLQLGSPSLPSGFNAIDRLQSIDRPTGGLFGPDGSLLLSLKRGEVQRFTVDPLDPDGALVPQAEPVIDLRAVVNESGDRGLIGMLLPPDLALPEEPGPIPRGWLYLSYTASPELDTDPLHNSLGPVSYGVVERVPLILEANGDWTTNLAGREILLGERLADGRVPDGLATVSDSHASCSMAFGSDGSLLIGAGDGASPVLFDFGGVDPAAFDDFVDPDTGLFGPYPADQDCGAIRSQLLNNLAGKVLRVDPETGLGLPSNPFFDGDPTSLASRVFALGLRNPFTLEREPGTGSIDPALGDPGTLWVGDVGLGSFEELIRMEAGGGNFGWPCREGPQLQIGYVTADPLDPNPHACPSCPDLIDEPFLEPLVAWPRSDPAAAVPPGSFVDVNGASIPGLTGNCAVAGTSYEGGAYPDEFDGRFFAGDFGAGWLASIESDPDTGDVLVHEFATGFQTLVDVIRHPQTGNLWTISYGGFVFAGLIQELNYSGQDTPLAVLELTPSSGPAPLTTQLDASGSSDPESTALSYEFDFGDGSPPLTSADPIQVHTYELPGVYTPSVLVTGIGGATDQATATLAVTDAQSELTLIQPIQNEEFASGESIVLSAQTSNPDLELTFTVDLQHNSHTHPAFFQAPGPLANFVVESHGVDGDLFFYRVEVSGVDSSDNQGGPPLVSEHVFIYLEGQVRDVTFDLAFTSSLDQLASPTPTGPANPDWEVLRDGIVPIAGASQPLETFTTEHEGDQGEDDWIGWLLTEPPHPDSRLIEVELTEGLFTPEGGWFESVTVEALVDAEWVEVQNLNSFPPYPGGPEQPTEEFRVTSFRFDPIAADGIRLRGVPGGTTGFVGASELRVRAVTPDPTPEGLTNFTELGTPIALSLENASDLGPANPDPQTFVNGTKPPAGSTSLHASFDSAALAPLTGEDWYGLTLASPARLSRIDYVEGAAHAGGGAFADLRVEYRLSLDAPWAPVSGLTIDPPFATAQPDVGFESFALTFDPVVAGEVRIIGTPVAPGGFAGLSELRVLGPQPPPGDCGTFIYGEEFGPYGVSWATATVPLAGEPMAILALGPGPGLGVIGLGLNAAEVPLGAGDVLLVELAPSVPALTVPFDGQGRALLSFTSPPNPALFGGSVYLQAVHITAESACLSPGLELRFCP